MRAALGVAALMLPEPQERLHPLGQLRAGDQDHVAAEEVHERLAVLALQLPGLLQLGGIA